VVRFADLAGYRERPPVVAIRHEEWLRKGGEFSEEAISFFRGEMNKPERDRSGHFSASSLGSCQRQQQFTFLGWKQLPESPQKLSVLMNGDFVHLRLQMAGISAGWLAQAEVKIPDNPYGVKGTMDGITDNGEVVEIKSQNSYGFRTLRTAGSAKEEHVFQVGTYLTVTGREKGVIVYENKDNQEILEFQVSLTPELEAKVLSRLLDLQTTTEKRELFPMIEPCTRENKGWQFKYCSYRDRCPLMKNFAQAEKQALKETKDA